MREENALKGAEKEDDIKDILGYVVSNLEAG
ncbi:hypothetical protein ASD8599_01587 [Ascidiaceihabitans donghaensis]|uniref:Uncharacterized protein n=1 Tax=Ascidiaceihabitans donghaensis TaxID=1510460 RepID=A0A2R8BCQ0_9RHOB|nr:hypothetical protein ASD8599_01587 [Ascidiaceihabitans donghaensis]